eukprot:IDg18169t1
MRKRLHRVFAAGTDCCLRGTPVNGEAKAMVRGRVFRLGSDASCGRVSRRI